MLPQTIYKNGERYFKHEQSYSKKREYHIFKNFIYYDTIQTDSKQDAEIYTDGLQALHTKDSFLVLSDAEYLQQDVLEIDLEA